MAVQDHKSASQKITFNTFYKTQEYYGFMQSFQGNYGKFFVDGFLLRYGFIFNKASRSRTRFCCCCMQQYPLRSNTRIIIEIDPRSEPSDFRADIAPNQSLSTLAYINILILYFVSCFKSVAFTLNSVICLLTFSHQI